MYSTISYRKTRIQRKENTCECVCLSPGLVHLVNNFMKSWDPSVFLLQQGHRMPAAPHPHPIFMFIFQTDEEGTAKAEEKMGIKGVT